MSAPPDYDIVIVGGGMVGASLALALRDLPLSVLLVEAVDPTAAAHVSFDDRSTALGNGSRQVFEALGIWSKLARDVAPIRRIHVSESGRFGFARLEAGHFDLDALGYVVPNRALGRELWSALRRAPRIELAMPARLVDVQFAPQQATVRIEGAATREVSARLVIAADGAQSPVRLAAGIEAQQHDYGQTAVVTSFASDAGSSADGTAYERFTAAGTLAVLPLPGARHTLIWAAQPDDATRLLALDDESFLRELQRVFGWRLGRVRELGRRGAYPLSLLRAERSVGPRSVLLGNASQALHPVAGQGFNLGLRDAAQFAELLADALGEGVSDIGAPQVLARFEAERDVDRSGVTRFTDGLIKLFNDRRPGVSLARNVGLLLFDVTPPAKRALAKLSWGFGARRPRLVRGLPLR